MIWPPLLVRMALTASGAARVCSILLLLLSVAPWASIYALLAGFRHSQHESFLSLEQELSQVLQHENATIEELWRALFRDADANIPVRWSETAADTHFHWTVVFPWGISLAFGILVPLFLSLCSYMQDDYPLIINPDDDPWISRHVKERHLYRLVAACQDYQKVLTKDDIADTSIDPNNNETTNRDQELISNDSHDNNNNEKANIDQEVHATRWNLPLPGSTVTESSTSSTTPTRCVEGTCAVCLSQYQVGDSVIWSSNLKCTHVFHDDCILSWLLRRRKKQCPCCRQSFLTSQK